MANHTAQKVIASQVLADFVVLNAKEGISKNETDETSLKAEEHQELEASSGEGVIHSINFVVLLI